MRTCPMEGNSRQCPARAVLSGSACPAAAVLSQGHKVPHIHSLTHLRTCSESQSKPCSIPDIRYTVVSIHLITGGGAASSAGPAGAGGVSAPNGGVGMGGAASRATSSAALAADVEARVAAEMRASRAEMEAATAKQQVIQSVCFWVGAQTWSWINWSLGGWKTLRMCCQFYIGWG